MSKEFKECFKSAKKDEEKGRKHKGLLVVEPSLKNAEEYLDKAKDSLRFCDIYKNAGSDCDILTTLKYGASNEPLSSNIVLIIIIFK